MANRLKGEVALDLSDGRSFVLVADFEMRVAVEDMADRPFPEVAQRAARGFQGAVRALFWGMLQRHHAELSMGDVTTLLEEDGEEIAAAMTRAVEAAESDASDSAPAGNGGGRRGGKSSGGSGAKSDSTPKTSGKRPRARSS